MRGRTTTEFGRCVSAFHFLVTRFGLGETNEGETKQGENKGRFIWLLFYLKATASAADPFLSGRGGCFQVQR